MRHEPGAGEIGVGEFSLRAGVLARAIRGFGPEEDDLKRINSRVEELFGLIDSPGLSIDETDVGRLLAAVKGINDALLVKAGGGRAKAGRRYRKLVCRGGREVKVMHAIMKGAHADSQHGDDTEGAAHMKHKVGSVLDFFRKTPDGVSDLNEQNGCGPESRDSIIKFVKSNFDSETREKEVEKMVRFAKSIGSDAAKGYFKVLAETMEGYGKQNVAALLDDKMVANAKLAAFLRENSDISDGYFYAVRSNPAELKRMADSQFLERLGGIASRTPGIFGSISPGDAGTYISSMLLSKVDGLEGKALSDAMARAGKGKSIWGEYVYAVADLSATNQELARAMLQDRVIGFLSSVGVEAGIGYANIVIRTRDARLTSEEFAGKEGVLRKVLAANGGDAFAESYFAALGAGSKKAMDTFIGKSFADFLSRLEERGRIGEGESLAHMYLKSIFSNSGRVDSATRADMFASGSFMDFVASMDREEAYSFLKGLYFCTFGKEFTTFLAGVIEKNGKDMQRVADRTGDLSAYYEGVKEIFGFAPTEEIEYLVRKGNKARISRLAENVRCNYSNVNGTKLAGYTNALAEYRKAGGQAARLIDIMDSLVVLSSASTSSDAAEEILVRVSKIMRQEEPAVDVAELRKRYPDVMEYVDRHIRYGEEHPDFKSKIDLSRVAALLSVCSAYGKPANVHSVDTEKQQAARRGQARFDNKFEARFMDELSSAADRARMDALTELLDLAPIALRSVVGDRADPARITPVLRDALLGQFNMGLSTVETERKMLTELIRMYYTDGAEAATVWCRGLEGNERIRRAMEGRGTNIEAMRHFSRTYSKADLADFDEEYRRKVGQEYVNALEVLGQIGRSSLADYGVEDIAAASPKELVSSAKRIEAAVRRMAEQGQIGVGEAAAVADLKLHLNGVAGAAGQVYSASKGGSVTFFASTDPMERLMLGMGFTSCLNVVNGINNFAAVSSAIDENNIIMYARDDRTGAIIGRVSLIESREGFVVNSGFYGNTRLNLFRDGSGWIDVLRDFARETGRPVLMPDAFVMGGGYVPSNPRLKELVAGNGGGRAAYSAHIEKAVCENIYSDLIGNRKLKEGGVIGEPFDGYRIG